MADVDLNASTPSTGAPLVDRLLSSTSPTLQAQHAAAAVPQGSKPVAPVADTLNRLHALPDTALFTSAEAAVYLNVGRELLRAWRWRGGGPAYVANGHLIRYRKAALDRFIGDERPEAA